MRLKHLRRTLALSLAALLSLSACSGTPPSPASTAAPASSVAVQEAAPTDAPANASTDEEFLQKLVYDAEQIPQPQKDVVFLEGSWEEMGYQYALQAPDALKRFAVDGLGWSMSLFEWSERHEAAQEYLDYYAAHCPELLELIQGMARGLEVPYEDLVMGFLCYVEAPAPEERTAAGGFCSTVAAWGSASQDGRLMIGANWDTEGVNHYLTPAVVAFPAQGNAFITGSGFYCNLVLNSKGLVVAGSSGQSAGEGDNALGIPVLMGQFMLAAKCDTAEQASAEYLKNYTTIYGESFHFQDTQGGHLITEASAAHHANRTAGDFGETDYLIATNDFMTEEMQSSVFPAGSGYDDCRPRYNTEERVVLDTNGQATLQTIAEALGSSVYYDKESGRWVEDNWNLETDAWSPEPVSPSFQNVLKTIAAPAEREIYIMNGCANTDVCFMPHAAARYGKLVLGDSPAAVTESAKETATMLIYNAAKTVAHSEPNEQADQALNTAKEALMEGTSYLGLASCALDEDARRAYFSQAASAYMRAQIYAQLASGDAYGVFQ